QFGSYSLLLGSSAFWIYVGASALTSAVFFAFHGGAPFIAVEVLHMTPAGYGFWFILCSIGYVIGNYGTARYSERLGIKTMMVVGTTLTVFAAVVGAVAIGAGMLSPMTLFAPM